VATVGEAASIFHSTCERIVRRQGRWCVKWSRHARDEPVRDADMREACVGCQGELSDVAFLRSRLLETGAGRVWWCSFKVVSAGSPFAT
jgi:hypothetical protein